MGYFVGWARSYLQFRWKIGAVGGNVPRADLSSQVANIEG
jgi:hypothetical protein